jgi:hypothetical protein
MRSHIVKSLIVRATALAGMAMLGACATSDPPPQLVKAGYACVDDSIECINRRQSLLRELTADKNRMWLREQPSPEAYASGVRMFALKSKKKELSCDELNRGRIEADGAPSSLRAAGNRLTPAQVSRGQMFAAEVGRELGGEFTRRCKHA